MPRTACRIWLTMLTSLLVSCTSTPALSPTPTPGADEEVIAFHSDPGGRDDFYLINAAGSGLRQITDGAETIAFPYWSPDGTRIAYLCCTGGEASVWVMDADGSNPMQLTEAPSGEPAWSPDGTQLAYASYADESIWVVSADGSERRSLEQQGGGPAWSPDGQRIAFFSRRDFPDQDQRNELYLVNADGTGEVRLTDDEVEDILPAWSPDGSRLAWIRSVDCIPHVFVMDSDGGNVHQLTGGPDPDDAAQWSPDGSRILFVRYLDGADPLMLGQGNAEIFTVARDTSVEVNLTNNEGWDGYPAWSPDGSQIAFGRNDGVQFNLMMMKADGSGLHELPGAPDATVSNDCCPAWRP